MFQNQMGIGMNPYGVGMNQFSQGMNWVDSLQDVEKVELPPGCDIVLFNKNKDEMYIRSRDRYSFYKTRIYELKEITPVQNQDKYITRDEFESILQKYLGGMRNDIVQPNEWTESTNTANSVANTADQSTGGSKRKENDADIAGNK